MKGKICVISTPTRRVGLMTGAFEALGRAGIRGANAGAKFHLCWLLTAIKIHISSAINYTIPRFTMRDHLRDCFGWLGYKPQPSFDKFISAFMEIFMVSLEKDGIPRKLITGGSGKIPPIVSGEHPFIPGETVEIDIGRGDRP